MQPVLPVGRYQEDYTPSVVTPDGTTDWAHAHASLIAVLVLIAFVLAAIALWRSGRQPIPIFADEDEPT